MMKIYAGNAELSAEPQICFERCIAFSRNGFANWVNIKCRWSFVSDRMTSLSCQTAHLRRLLSYLSCRLSVFVHRKRRYSNRNLGMPAWEVHRYCRVPMKKWRDKRFENPNNQNDIWCITSEYNEIWLVYTKYSSNITISMLLPYKLAQNGLTKERVCHIIISVAARTAAKAEGRATTERSLKTIQREREEKKKSE